MKKLLLILLVVCAAGCEFETKEPYEISPPQIVIIDGCEYFENHTHNGWNTYTHRGNCKNCRKFLTELYKK